MEFFSLFLLIGGLSIHPAAAQDLKDCPDPILLAREARLAIAEARMQDGDALLAQAREALPCHSTPAAAQLAEFWMSDGALRFFLDEDRPSAILALQAAGRIAPDAWDPMLGSELEAAFREGATIQTHGSIALDTPLPRGYHLHLDAEKTRAPITTSSGYHYASLVDRRGQVHQDWLFVLVPETTRTLQVNPLPRQRARGALIAAGASALAAGGLAIAAVSLDRRLEDIAAEEGVDALDRAYHRHVAYGVTSYSLMALSATGLTLYIVL